MPEEFEVESCGGSTTVEVPTGEVIDLLASKYAMQILYVVGAAGGAQFGDLEDALPGASSATLSARLGELTAAGLLSREEHDELPPRVEYELTADGESLRTHLAPVLEWVTDFET